MSRLLIVTDNTFYRQGAAVFDRFCFDRAFFDDYAAVFDEVRVAARVDHGTAVDGMHRADGQRIVFADLANVEGAAWVLAPRQRYCRPLADAVAWADGVCVRIPAVAGWHAARLARRLGKPLMFELVGDPLAAGTGPFAQILGGLIQHWRTRQIVRWSSSGSYVSRVHLQERYPAAAGAITASISSIRLPATAFRPPRIAPARPDRLRLVCVGSFLPVKNHATLLRAVALAKRESVGLSLTLVGDGPLRPAIEAQIPALGLEAEVRLTGHLVGRPRVEAELDAADVFLIPSWSEGLPRAAIEAMARGLPVLGSAAPGLRELLPPICLFDPRRPEEIAALIKRMRCAGFYRRGAELSERIAAQFAVQAISPRRQAFYKSFLGSAAQRSTTSALTGEVLMSGAVL